MKRLLSKLEYFVIKNKISWSRMRLLVSRRERSSRKEIIWIYGPSCVGKKSLMFRLANSGGRSGNAAKIFGIDAVDLVIPVVIPSRIRGKTDAEKREVAARRADALRAIYESDVNAKWLVHMQTIDLRENIAAKVVESFPQVKSRCFYLGIDEKKYSERYKKDELSHGQAYKFKEKHLKTLSSIFGGAVEINL